jgi:aspartate racemase
MPKHVGIVACSPPGAAACYERIATRSVQPLEVSVHAQPFSIYMRHIDADDWSGVAELMLDSAKKLATIGAHVLIAPCNTIHNAFDLVQRRSPLPWLHIAAEVAKDAKRRGYRRIGLLGTKRTMESPLYPAHLEPCGIECVLPEPEERREIDRFIFDEMVGGTFSDEAREYLNGIIGRLKQRGCDAAGLCCTELPLLLKAGEPSLPLLDSTAILAHAAIERSVTC